MSNEADRPTLKGRGASRNPPNRFQKLRCDDDFEQFDLPPAAEEAGRGPATEYLPDDSQSIVAQNDSPDVGFRYSVNPYRGCLHGCAYCYARPSHEYLGLSAGLDFETKILVKHRAPQLLRAWLSRREWRPEPICFSGVTDCYQPAERHFRLTRGCLEVALEARQPVSIVTKNALVCRDLDLLAALARHGAASVLLSITTLDAKLAGVLEPRTSRPEARLRAIATLRDAGVPVGLMLAPVIPGLTDTEMPAVLHAAAEAGADWAAATIVRLPLAVEAVFRDWLARHRSESARRVLARIQACRNGQLNDAQFGVRMRGSGPLAEQILQAFRVFARKNGLHRSPPALSAEAFRPPRAATGQGWLF